MATRRGRFGGTAAIRAIALAAVVAAHAVSAEERASERGADEAAVPVRVDAAHAAARPPAPLFESALERSYAPFYWELFRAARFGADRTERAAWVVWPRDAAGPALVRWPWTARFRTEAWVGPRPPDTVALVHTHPTDTSPLPSAMDVQTAATSRVPVYTVSRSGVYKATPEGEVVEVESGGWLEAAQRTVRSESGGPTRVAKVP